MEYLGGGSALDLVSEVMGKEKGNESMFFFRCSLALLRKCI